MGEGRETPGELVDFDFEFEAVARVEVEKWRKGVI